LPLLEFIAARLRELRRKHDLTQEQVALLLETDLKWYQRVEWRKKDVRASTIERLAAVFGVTLRVHRERPTNREAFLIRKKRR
jgi:transcriptional regulator with XRE-family HTH domain